MLAIEMAACSERGGRASNEDAWATGPAEPACRFAVLADGAGGHERGAEAARQVVAHVDAALRPATACFSPATLTAALRAAHAALQARQPSAEGRERMHSTIVVLWIDGAAERVLWGHVGDSRLYRVRRGRSELLTVDDSVVQHLQTSGALTAAQAAGHPLRNQLLSALGMREAIEPQELGSPMPLHDGDAFLLCSDGWWGLLDDADIAGTLLGAASPLAWLQAMASKIHARDAPGGDNYTAVAVWASDPAEATQGSDDAETTVIDPVWG